MPRPPKPELWQGDCLELMHRIPDGSVDMICCDLPYGTTACKWDSIIPFEPLWAHYKRVIKKNGAIVLFGSQPFTSALVMSNPAWFKYSWVWIKDAPTGFLNAHGQPLKLHEDIAVFSEGKARKKEEGAMPYTPQNTRLYGKTTRRGGAGSNYHKAASSNHQEFTDYPRTVLFFDSDRPKAHPTQKPVALCEYLVRTYTNPGETVLDNCAGSGTTGVACAKAGRTFLGIEQDAGYFAIAQKRVAEANAQSSIFDVLERE